jgi:hypothetical protein
MRIDLRNFQRCPKRLCISSRAGRNLGNQSGNHFNRVLDFLYRFNPSRYALIAYSPIRIRYVDWVRSILVPVRIPSNSWCLFTRYMGSMADCSHSVTLGKGNPWFGITLFSARAIPAIFLLKDHLTPDSYEFAHGAASWSSPLAALFGHFWGYLGIEIFGTLGAIFLGLLSGSYSWRFSLLLFLSPPGWYAMQASADAAGAAAAGIASDRNFRMVYTLPIAAFHLEAGLVYLFCALASKIRITWPCVAIIGGVFACIAQHHWQTRYLLPGVLIWAARSRRQLT